MRKSEDEWRIVANYRSSGLSVRHFCGDNGIGEQSLYSRIKRMDTGPCPGTERVHGFALLTNDTTYRRMIEKKGWKSGRKKHFFLTSRMSAVQSRHRPKKFRKAAKK